MSGNQMEAMVVEDDKVLKFGLMKCLEEEGYSVIVSENYAEASGALKSEAISLVILDVNLPGKPCLCIRHCPAKGRGETDLYPNAV